MNTTAGRDETFSAKVCFENLSRREQEVLHLAAQGLTNKAIAIQLSISEHTVNHHMEAVCVALLGDSRTAQDYTTTRRVRVILMYQQHYQEIREASPSK